MSGRQTKALRGEVRQEVKQLLSQELLQSILQQVATVVNTRLDAIDKHIRAQLTEINERSEETQAYVVRNLVHAQAATAPSKVDETAETPAS